MTTSSQSWKHFYRFPLFAEIGVLLSNAFVWCCLHSYAKINLQYPVFLSLIIISLTIYSIFHFWTSYMYYIVYMYIDKYYMLHFLIIYLKITAIFGNMYLVLMHVLRNILIIHYVNLANFHEIQKSQSTQEHPQLISFIQFHNKCIYVRVLFVVEYFTNIIN